MTNGYSLVGGCDALMLPREKMTTWSGYSESSDSHMHCMSSLKSEVEGNLIFTCLI